MRTHYLGAQRSSAYAGQCAVGTASAFQSFPLGAGNSTTVGHWTRFFPNASIIDGLLSPILCPLTRLPAPLLHPLHLARLPRHPPCLSSPFSFFLWVYIHVHNPAAHLLSSTVPCCLPLHPPTCPCAWLLMPVLIPCLLTHLPASLLSPAASCLLPPAPTAPVLTAAYGEFFFFSSLCLFSRLQPGHLPI